MYNVNRRLKHCTEKRSISELHRSLRAKIEQSKEFSNASLDQLSQWQGWYDSSFISNLEHNAAELDKVFNIRLDDCLASIAHGLPPEQRESIRSKQKRELQKTVALQISRKLCVNGPNRIRQKLKRWMDTNAASPKDIVSAKFKIPGPPKWVADRVHRNLNKLASLVPPRVSAAVLRVICNMWCTSVRFQQSTSFGDLKRTRVGAPKNAHGDHCRLGCGTCAKDSIEHYARCSNALKVLHDKLHIDVSAQRGLEFFVMGTIEQSDKEILALSALYVYAIYCTFNGYRCTGPKDPSTVYQCIWQHMLQGCRGHSALERSLNSRWNAPICTIR